MGFDCKRCGESFCSKCRLPEFHECQFMHLKTEDIAMKMHYHEIAEESPVENPVPKAQAQPGARRIHRPDFADEENDPGIYMSAPPMAINMKMTMFMYLLFVAFDLFFLVVFKEYLMAIPMVIHAVFLPVVVSLVLKQKKFGDHPGLMADFIKVNLRYIIVHIITRIVVAIIMMDLISLVFLGLIGFRIAMTWYQLSRLMKLASRERE